jgi:histidinol-phosphate aminotransferase
LTQNFISQQLEKEADKANWVKLILEQKAPFVQELDKLPIVEKIYPSDANFLLVKVTDANGIYKNLVEQGIIVRNRHSVSLCGNCLRITIGTKEENRTLINALKEIIQ